MHQPSFKRHRFPPEIIRHSIWLYARLTLNFRDVEEMLAERSLDVSYETIRRWFLKFGSAIAANLRRIHPRPSDHWHLDEMVIVIRRKRYWLWRAVDNEGEVLDFLVQRKRDAKAAKKLMKKLLKKQGFAPSRIVTDKLRSYPAAFRALDLAAQHDRGLRANNRAENAHQPATFLQRTSHRIIRCLENRERRHLITGPCHPNFQLRSLCDKASVAIAEIPYALKIGVNVITHNRHLCYHCWLSEGVIREKSVKLTMSTLGLSRPTEFLEGTGYREWYPPITIGAEIRTAICR